MLFEKITPLDFILKDLFHTYLKRVPNVKKITQAMIDHKMISSQEEIINDHIAFRTIGVEQLGIQSFEKIFLKHGYTKIDAYFFESKKLNAYWYAPPSPEYPKVFISELRVHDLSETAQKIISKYTDLVSSDPLDAVNLEDAEQIAHFLKTPLWILPSIEDYETLLKESEYAAWVIYNRYYLNHYTISVHELPAPYNELQNFNDFLKSIGIKLNNSGGEIKTSADGLLLQSSSVAEQIQANFQFHKTKYIAGSYVEFAQRKLLPEYAHLPEEVIKSSHRREGFEAGNADKIFESTYTEQINNNN